MYVSSSGKQPNSCHVCRCDVNDEMTCGWDEAIVDADSDDDDDDDDSASGRLQGLNINLVFTTIIIVFGSSFQFGYNIGVLNQVDSVSRRRNVT